MLTRHRIIGTIGYMGGIPSVPETFCCSLANTLLYTQEALCGPGEHIHFDRTKFSLHDFARNDLVNRMKGEWLAMLDTDMGFEPDFIARLVRLLETRSLDVVSGIYSYKLPPHYPVAYQFNPESDMHERLAMWDPAAGPLLQIDSAGGGCLVVRRRVFERIKTELRQKPFDRFGAKGEDHSFFIRCRQLGVPCWLAHQVEADHLAEYGVRTSRDYVMPAEADHLYERQVLA